MRPACWWCDQPSTTVVIRELPETVRSFGHDAGTLVCVYLCRRHDASARVLVIHDAIKAEMGVDRLDVIVGDVTEVVG